MKVFKKLNLPKPHTIRKGTHIGKNKWFCSVEGSAEYYLHDDLHIYCRATPDGHSEHTGFFDSEEEALDAYKNYYYLHAKEPGH